MLTLKKTLYIGVWLCIIPFLGVPGIWKERLFILTGLYLVGVALYRYYTNSHLHREREASPEKPNRIPEATQ